MHKRIIDITGNKYGKLSVMKISSERNNSGDILWECKCECGNIKLATSGNLRNGDAKSCGCLKIIDYEIFTGQLFGRLTILKFTKNKKEVFVQCKCGKKTNKKWRDIKSGKTKSCGCLVKEGKSRIDMIGKTFGYLTVISRSPKRNKHKDVLWDCLCHCGKIKLCTTGALEHGGNTSCGCMQGNPTHRDWNLRIRRIWVGMIARCTSPTATSYHNYGAKGVSVCKEWNDYFIFKKWALNNGYEDHLTLDRFPDKKGNYEPTNCRWATYRQQANNKSNNTVLIIDNEPKTISEWATISGINQARISSRIKNGWDYKRAVFEPINKSKAAKKHLKNVNRTHSSAKISGTNSKTAKTKKAHSQKIS